VSPLPELENECFFIAPIGEADSLARNRSDDVLDFIVARAADEVDLQAVRGDQLAEPGQITSQVIQHVLGARAAVADLTGRNPNVYYELAIRHTARLPTVLIAEEGEQLPFDVAPMRTIFFRTNDLRSADRCRDEIVQHLRRALDGAVDSPITTSIDLQRLQAGNTVERNVAELVTGFSHLEKELQRIRYEFSLVRRTDRREQVVTAGLANMGRQRTIVQHLNNRLMDLLRVVRQHEDPELQAVLMEAESLGLALALSFLTDTPMESGTVAEESVRAAEQLYKAAVEALNRGTQGDSGDAQAMPAHVDPPIKGGAAAEGDP
jgi:hypothetical protein